MKKHRTNSRNVSKSFKRALYKTAMLERLEDRTLMANNFLAGTAFIDANSNGTLDTDEAYLPNATIELRSADGSTLIATDTTDSVGGYLFENLTPGNYKLVNLSANNYVSSATQALSKISPVTGSTSNSINVTLLDPADLQASIDIGAYFSSGLFQDMNYNIFGTPVIGSGGQLPAKLYSSAFTPSPTLPFLTLCVDLFNDLNVGVNGPFTVIPGQAPSGSGSPQNGPRIAYLYNHYGQTPLSSTNAAALQLAVWELLYDSDGNLATGNFKVTSASAAVQTQAGIYLTQSLGKAESAIFLNVPPPSPSVPTLTNRQGIIVTGAFNFGNAPAAQLGDFVWEDLDADGIQDTGEPGIAGVAVTISGPNGYSSSTNTDSTGYYQFTGLAAGNYTVSFATPTGFTPTTSNVGSDDNVDSDGLIVTNIPLGAGQSNQTIDQGFYRRVKLGDFVWEDLDADGIQDAGEPGIPGVTVTLTGPNGTSTATTDSSGLYLFENLVPGVYAVTFSGAPTGYVATQSNVGGNDSIDSDGPSVTNITLVSGVDNLTIDQGYYRRVKLGDFVWEDLDADGIQDAGEPGIPGVTVTLTGPNGTSTATTDSSGLYLFENLVPGVYAVTFSGAPTGYVATQANAGLNDSVDSDGPSVTNITLVSGVDNLTIDQGYYRRVKLGDFVWEDLDADGIQDAGEPGIPGVTVTLTGPNGTSTATTDSSGLYLFENLVPGVYAVTFSGAPTGYVATQSNVGGNDSIDSDGPSVTNIALVSGVDNLTIDQGYYRRVKLGDFVWEDLDADGIQDAGEPGIPGVTVTLTGPNGTSTATTDSSGLYLFENLVPGVYAVTFSGAPADFVATQANAGLNDSNDSDGPSVTNITLVSGVDNLTIDQGYYRRVKLGDFVWEDLDADGIQDAGEPGIPGVTVSITGPNGFSSTTTTDSNGLYLFNNLVPGVYAVTFSGAPADFVATQANAGLNDSIDSDGPSVTNITLVSGVDNLTIDQGYYRRVKLGDFVWEDLDADGIQDAGEPGIPGVTVSITGPNGFSSTTTTDSNGLYLFNNLVPGVYAVTFSGAPADFVATQANAGLNDSVDSDGPSVTNITLVSGVDNLTIDQGYYEPASLGDFVWEDTNANGIQDSGETGLSGVIVTLFRDGNPTGITTTTDANGIYGFADLVPGNYTVEFAQPAGYQVSPSNVGSDDTNDSDGLVVTGINLVSGEDDLTIDQGFYQLASLGDFVWEDKNANGIQDSGEPGIAGVQVTISGPNGFTQTVSTSSTGAYGFNNLIPGTYSVSFATPTGYVVTAANQGGDTTKDSNGVVVATNAVANGITLVSGENNPTIDQGFYRLASIGNFVWNDVDADGIQDPTELGIPGITVTLLKDGVPFGSPVTTDASGNYTFAGLMPGNYAVLFGRSIVYTQVSPLNQGGDDTIDSDGTAATVGVLTGLLTQTVQLQSGEKNTTLDQGYYAETPRDVCLPIDMQGNTSVNGTAGNIRTFTSGGVTVRASAYSRTTTGTWGPAYLGAYGGGLGVTDGSEDGSSDTHTTDNIGRLNYVVFEFSQSVVVDSVFLGYVVGDSDLTVWIGNSSTFSGSLSDAFLSNLLLVETNLTTSTSARLADINAGKISGNILIVAAQVDDTTPEDRFKIQTLNICVPGGPSQTASLGDYVWHDMNGNGVQESTEPGIAGATVTLVGGGPDGLINGVGDTTTITTTDATGKYQFANLVPGTSYQVTFSLPAGFDAATGRKVGSNAALDSDGLVSDVVVLSAGQNNTTIDAGFIKYVKVGNFVWNDLNSNGLQDTGEPGIAGVQLTLAGTTGAGVAVTQSTTTASNGSYQFSTLPPGTYTVSIAASNFTSGGALVGFTASPTLVGTDRGIDSNVSPSATSPAALQSGGSDQTVDFGYYTATTQVCVSLKLEGSSSTSGSAGNIRTYSASGVGVKASAFSRDSSGAWSTAFLGTYGGGLGVTDGSEGTGGNNTHTVDNVGRNNYILFEFSQPVLIDSAFLGYVVGDSDLTAWIGTVTDPYNNHRTLSDSLLSGFVREDNDTTLTTTRTANLNAGGLYGNVFVVAASISDSTPDDWFKLAELSFCAKVATTTAPTKFFVADDDTNKTFKYTSSVQYTSNFAVAPTSPMGIAANPSGSNVWVADLNGRIYRYDSNGTPINNWNTGVSRIQGVSTNGTSIWTVSDYTDRVYFYSGAASFTPSNYKPNPSLTSSFALHFNNSNPTDLATDGTYVWVVNEGNISGGAGDMIYKYTVSGTYLGRWQLDSRNARPTGITIDPLGGSKIWVVDNGNDTVFEYSGATGCVSGGLIAAKTYLLNAGVGNTNPQGIADPPGADDSVDLVEALPASLLVDGTYVNPDVNPFNNSLNATDVNDDGVTTAIDALTIINRLNTQGSTTLTSADFAEGDRWTYEDVNGDGVVSPIDALYVINQLNTGTPASMVGLPEEVPVISDDDNSAASDVVFGDMGTGEGEMDMTAFVLDDLARDTVRRRR